MKCNLALDPALPINQGNEVIDRGLGAASAHLAKEPIVGHQEKWTPRLPQIHVELA